VRFAFAWDGKSTLGKSVGVSRVMWEKAKEQAGGERPALPLRFYDNERLDVGEDLIVLGLDDFAELLAAANGVQEKPGPVVVSAYVEELSDSPRYRLTMFQDGMVSWPNGVRVEHSVGGLPRLFVDGVQCTGSADFYINGKLHTRVMDAE
jgi:hypothetical protein